MAKKSGSTDQLMEVQARLQATHAMLVKEFDTLHHSKFNAANHQSYLEKLRAHLIDLEAHTADIQAHHDALHARGLALHEKHEADAARRSTSPPPKSRRTRSR